MPVIRILTRHNTPERDVTVSASEITIGRAPDNTIVLPDQTLSRHHARLVETEEGYDLIDNDSGNGVWIEEKRVKRHPLKHAQYFRLGSRSFQYLDTRQIEVTLTGGDRPAIVLPPSPEPPPPPEPAPAVEEKAPAVPRRSKPLSPTRPMRALPPLSPATPPPPAVSLAERLRARIPRRALAAIAAVLVLLVVVFQVQQHAVGTRRDAPAPADTAQQDLPAPIRALLPLTFEGVEEADATLPADGGRVPLEDSAYVEVAGGTFTKPVEVELGRLDLRLERASKEVAAAWIYLVAFGDARPSGTSSILLDLPLPRGASSVARLEGTSWSLLAPPSGTRASLPVGPEASYVMLVQWAQDRPAPEPEDTGAVDQLLTASLPWLRATSPEAVAPAERRAATVDEIELLKKAVTDQIDQHQGSCLAEAFSLGDAPLYRSTLGRVQVLIDPELQGRLAAMSPNGSTLRLARPPRQDGPETPGYRRALWRELTHAIEVAHGDRLTPWLLVPGGAYGARQQRDSDYMMMAASRLAELTALERDARSGRASGRQLRERLRRIRRGLDAGSDNTFQKVPNLTTLRLWTDFHVDFDAVQERCRRGACGEALAEATSPAR